MAEATADLFGTWTLDGVPGEVVNRNAALKEQLDPQWQVDRIAWHDVSQAVQHAHHADVVIAVLGKPGSFRRGP